MYPLTFMRLLSIRIRNLCVRLVHASVTSACTEQPRNTGKVFFPIRRISGKYLRVHEEYDDEVGLFAVHN
jgi:hypothetical protein